MKLKATRAPRNSSGKSSGRLPLHRLRNKNIRQFIGAAPDATIIMDRSGAIVTINSNAEKLFGYDTKQLIGKDIELLIPNLHKTVKESNKGFYRKPKNLRLGSK